jgi:hypothetical protein
MTATRICILDYLLFELLASIVARFVLWNVPIWDLWKRSCDWQFYGQSDSILNHLFGEKSSTPRGGETRNSKL